MMKYKYLVFSVMCSASVSLFGGETFKEENTIRGAGYQVIDGGLVSAENIATHPVEEHYNNACSSFNAGNWPEAATQFYIVSLNFPNTSYGHDALFYQAIAKFQMGEFDIANQKFEEYLKCQSNPRYFVETMEYKLAIADNFRCGAKKRLFGSEYMPKFFSGRTLALQIYDEVIAAMPNHELAAQALFSKGCIQRDLQEYNDSIESFQSLTRRFPKNEYAPEAYLLINRIYIAQCKREFQNSDFVALSEINLRRFREAFPQDDRIQEAENDVLAIKEVYAKGLFDTGRFYERIQQTDAAVIYYKKALNDYPDTRIALFCRERLSQICPDFSEFTFSDV
jgi:outer membrane protein assembly factor BamD (BamD/ComL family)